MSVISGTLDLKERMKDRAKALLNRHRPDGSADTLVFTMPRSGSTWLMELIASQPGYRTCSEPLNLRFPLVRHHLGFDRWEALHEPGHAPSITRYLQRHCSGELHFLDPMPTRSAYRYRTNRTVLKIIHGAEEHIESLRNSLRANVVYLVRHPIAVSISRESFPRLHALIESPYGDRFTSDERSTARRIAHNGTPLERGVLEWCLQNAIPLRNRKPEWLVLTYEQLVLKPEPAVHALTRAVGATTPQRMLQHLRVPSAVRRKSDHATQQMLRNGTTSDRNALVEKWRTRVTIAEARGAMELLDAFDLPLYRPDDPLPDSRWWIDGEAGGDHVRADAA